ncbi:uncharacterized protein LOC116851189 [Odontomachus brunneus]|uniref:uncharacterized protein LOC116851189 n=1 Tax=Odontomachus brunneus TaxID=486640 RepID=UPI0013F1A2C6|nr:uncharacterized protein LOC116851189 [Odontomachus brunneus]
MQHHKIIERPRDLLQFRRDAMMIFIIILSLVVRAISSLLFVQGSSSTLDDDTASIDLFSNKSNDGVNELVEKLHGTKRIRLTIDLVEKIINIQQAMLEINDGIDHHQNYLGHFNFLGTFLGAKIRIMQNQPHVSETKMDKISAMDEILKAVHQVLPMKKSAKIPSKKPKVTFGMS